MTKKGYTNPSAEKPNADALKSVLTVGDARGFVVEIDGTRYVITAAHCLPQLPPPHPAAYRKEKTWRILGPLKGYQTKIWTECSFVDPVADIAVLMEAEHDSEEYWKLIDSLAPFEIADASDHDRGWVLTLDSVWIECEIQQYGQGGTLWIKNAADIVAGGMSGSPILNRSHAAIGVISCSINTPSADGGPNPQLTCALPGRLLVWRKVGE